MRRSASSQILLRRLVTTAAKKVATAIRESDPGSGTEPCRTVQSAQTSLGYLAESYKLLSTDPPPVHSSKDSTAELAAVE